MTTRKIIFLDIDGVLNSVRSAIALGGYPHSLKPQCMEKFDQTAIGLMRLLCRETGAQIVISSTWRRSTLSSDIGAGLGLPVIGSASVMDYARRGDEIARWIGANEPVSEYVIIDDDSDFMRCQRKHFVKVNGQIGLTYANFLKASVILGGTKG